MPFTNVFKIVGKAFKSATKRPFQRFNIYNRSKKYIGEDSKHFFPAPRAIGPVTKIGPSQYPHLEDGGGVFKSVNQRRIEAIEARKKKLLESNNDRELKSFSDIKQDDSLVIDASQKMLVIKTTNQVVPSVKALSPEGGTDEEKTKLSRPLPKLVNLDMHDPSSIWIVDKVPPGRLDLDKLQELMLNKIEDDNYWTPKRIAETYNIKEEYAKSLVTYLKQIRIVISPRMAKVLDYVNLHNETYNATKHIVYIVDKSLRSELDKSADGTFLPEDELDDKIRELLNAGQVQKRAESEKELKELYNMKRPAPLKIEAINKPKQLATSKPIKDLSEGGQHFFPAENTLKSRNLFIKLS